ncbi:MAG: nucleotidyltransferase domain-containing protein [Leptospiraceae bacterium]|nr:nucleotidyltransferase domain-containing protein [Leptospiraceae bacterium]
MKDLNKIELLALPVLESQISISKNPIITFFSEKVRDSLKEKLLFIVLFGSRARGDAKEFSDYDFLILLKEKNKSLKKKIIDVEVATLDEFDRLVSSLVWQKKDWDIRKNFPIGKNILQDGILVWTNEKY